MPGRPLGGGPGGTQLQEGGNIEAARRSAASLHSPIRDRLGSFELGTQYGVKFI